jgi:hypothetical protein
MTIDESDDELVCMAFDESPLDEEIRLPVSHSDYNYNIIFIRYQIAYMAVVSCLEIYCR